MKYLKERWKHQQVAEERAVQGYMDARAAGKPFGFAFFMDPGTGKTGTAINVIRRITNLEKRHLRVLIVAPPVVVGQWKEEFKAFSHIDPKTIQLLQGPGTKRLTKFRSFAFNEDSTKRPGIFITNYEFLTGRRGSDLEQLYHEVRRWEPELIVWDESHYLKDRQAKRSQQADLLCNPSDKRLKIEVPRPAVLELSGTPILNNEMDLFQQFLVLDGGESFGDNFFSFRARFFFDKNANMPRQRHFPDFRIKTGARDQITHIIAAKSSRAVKSECLDLPPLIQQTILLDMTEEQAHHYNAMKRDLITFIQDDACTAQLAITKALRLMQITSGFMRFEDGTDHLFKGNPKRQAVQDLLEMMAFDHKVILWGVFKPDYQMIKDVAAKLKLPIVALHGGMTDKARRESARAFNEDERVRLCVGHPGSGGIGVNLTASSRSIYVSRNFSLGQRIQSQARNYRGGSERHENVTHYDLCLRRTIEEDIIKSLDQKTEMSLSLLRGLVAPKSLGGY